MQSSRFFLESSSRDLQIGHGCRACSFEDKGSKLDCSCLGGLKTKKKRKDVDQISEMLVPGALNDTITIRKASADIVANFGLGKPGQI